MNGLEITKELKNDIEANQIRLQNAICNHQALVHKAKDLCNDDKESISKAIKEAEQDIIQIGLEQRGLLERLREEYKSYQKSLKNQVIKTALEERRTTLTTSLNRARKQNLLPRTRTSPSNSLSDESEQRQSSPIYQEDNPVVPQDLAQPDFLAYFRLTTHEIFVEMQKKRAERKRRSTANPQFLYGNKGWDWGPPMKKKRNHFLAHPPSPPNTRGRKKQEMAIMARVKSPSLEKNKSAVEKSINNNSNIESKTDLKPIINPFPSIPNLPSGLIIERISPGSTSPDSKQCIVCKQPGDSAFCSRCSVNMRTMFERVPHELPQSSICSDPKGVSQMSAGQGEAAQRQQHSLNQ
ncbi:hypothetical protein ABEB36_004544 [Hypothenemus hampei]|uniref:Uncharacterized protein n=1 Tax=Hypothenemus hampei TaxID=57062 RepID=A0ABD1F3P0_HYPHA